MADAPQSGPDGAGQPAQRPSPEQMEAAVTSMLESVVPQPMRQVRRHSSLSQEDTGRDSQEQMDATVIGTLASAVLQHMRQVGKRHIKDCRIEGRASEQMEAAVTTMLDPGRPAAHAAG